MIIITIFIKHIFKRKLIISSSTYQFNSYFLYKETLREIKI